MPITERPKIIADQEIPYLKGVLESVADITYLPSTDITKHRIREADALMIRTRTKSNKNLLEGTDVRFIASATSGIDHVDTTFCRSAGIEVRNAPGCNSSAVAQYIGSSLMNIFRAENRRPEQLTLGIIGVGHVGKKVSDLAQSLGMSVLLNDPPRQRIEGDKQFTPLVDLIKKSDIITLHVPFNRDGIDKTEHLVNEAFLRRMQPKGWLINASRGEVTSSQALLKAPESIKLILDVWENEPHIDNQLLKRTRLGTPHIAGYSVNGKANATMQSVRALSSFFGLGVENYVPKIPLPADDVIVPKGLNPMEKLSSAVLRTYDIGHDDKMLKNNPEAFEMFRKDYRCRWEFENYTVALSASEKQLASWFNKIGFNLQNR